MSATEHVSWTFRRKFTDGSEHDLCEVLVTMLLHDWNNTTDRVNGEVKLTHSLCRLLSQMAVDSSLDWSVKHGILCSMNRSFASLYGCLNRLQHLVFRHIWSAKDIEHGCNIHTDGTLEFNNFFHAYLNIAVDIGLEGSGICHNDAGEVDEVVNTFLNGMLLQIIMLPNDVRVSDEALNSVSIPHLSRLNGPNVWIDDR